MIKLSILIATIESRAALFAELYLKIDRQKTQEVEILSEIDNKQISIGRKRQILLERAKGDYVVFIDDDDDVSMDYIDQILQAIKTEPDCVGMLIDCDMQGVKRNAIASLKYNNWGENKDGFKYVRSPYHKTPVKRWIALKAGFPDKRFGEDYEYSMRLINSGLLKTEVMVKSPIYFYRYKYENPKTKYGIK
jgi:glycosyltransferase involved in cell wall biosynthesis